MSFRDRVTQTANHQFTLPPVGGMKVPVTAFLSPRLFEATDEKLWAQAAQATQYPGVKSLSLMPDCHLGFGIPVGGVLVTDEVLVQAGSGYDINCGVLYLQVPGLHASDVANVDRRLRWVRAVEERVAMGLGSHRPAKMQGINSNRISEIFRYGAKALGVSADLCERPFIPVGPEFTDQRVERAYSKAVPQLGSLGGGNHFVELQVEETDGSVWIMIHTGSRGFGWQTAEYYFHAGAALRGLPPKRREDSWLYVSEPLGKEFWAHHNAAANYAAANRHQIVHGVREATQEVFGTDVQGYYDISHNLIQQETLVQLDGVQTKGFVHRKGATRAFPAGHPDLRGSSWAETGHPVLIPGSMLTGAAILFPQDGAYQTVCSVNHGSGRLMGRGQAKRELGALQDEIDQEMRGVSRILGGVPIMGIVGNTGQTPIDECGMVYKDLDAVLSVLVNEGIAQIKHRMRPVANLKGVD